jgi:cytochrome c553
MKTLIKIGAIVWLSGALALPAWAQQTAGGVADEPLPADLPLLQQLRKAEADPALSQAALKQGAKLAAFCANCHGANGNSTHPDTPNLAGQNPLYLLGQTLKFADGRRRYEWMEGLIKAMKPDEIIAVALYYSRQPVTTKVSPDSAALIEQGKTYFNQVCFRCHGANGHGSENYARLAGQQEPYVILTLHRYKDGNGVRMDPLMASTTKLMNDQTIRAVAAYVASMP